VISHFGIIANKTPAYLPKSASLDVEVRGGAFRIKAVARERRSVGTCATLLLVFVRHGITFPV
jgi:hypothetical protein